MHKPIQSDLDRINILDETSEINGNLSLMQDFLNKP